MKIPYASILAAAPVVPVNAQDAAPMVKAISRLMNGGEEEPAGSPAEN